MTIRRLTRITALCLCLFIGLVSTTMLSRSSAQSARPVEMDVRGVAGVPKGTARRAPVLSQVKALTALQATVRDTIQVRYNGLTATPRFMFSTGCLSIAAEFGRA